MVGEKYAIGFYEIFPNSLAKGSDLKVLALFKERYDSEMEAIKEIDRESEAGKEYVIVKIYIKL